MKATSQIWVPTLQKYIRMTEMNCEQYRTILKSIDDDSDFEYSITEIINSNLKKDQTDNFNILDDTTVLDVFLILLQMKVISCGEQLKLMRICDKCGQKTNFHINLNNLLDELSKDLDKSFSSYFNYGNIKIRGDIPSFKHFSEMKNLRIDNFKKEDVFPYTFIKSIYIHHASTEINFKTRSLSEIKKVCDNIGYKPLLDIHKLFISQIHNMFKNLLFVKSVCQNQFCKDELEIKMDINNMTDLMRILFKDSSAFDILNKYANASMNCHFDYNMYNNITPLELNHVIEMINQSNAPDNTEKSNKDINLFEEYRMQTDGMVESPSEFE